MVQRNAFTTFPIRRDCLDRIALSSKDHKITYRDLLKLEPPKNAIFFTPLNIKSILQVISSLLYGKMFLPISPREQSLPLFNLPPIGGSCLATSGSTGLPKHVVHNLESHLISAKNLVPETMLSPGDQAYLSLPLNHIGGLSIIIRALISGATLLLPDMPIEHATHLSFVPTQLKRTLEKATSLPRLKALLMGGAAIPKKLCDKAIEKNIPLFLTYGMTEMASQIATTRYSPSKGVVFGSPLPEREMKIDSDKEIWVKGKTLFQGYLNNTPPFVDGWFPTGDLGELSPSGLTIIGRKKNMIISGGENIYLEELEKAFLSIQEVKAVSLGVRIDEEYGERPTALVTLSNSISKEALQKSLKEELIPYKIPYLEDLTIKLSSPE